ncbi:S-adenosyl-L-methionine-dependent methyltransferase [Coniella lustricola]|uniref:S-adenosyl-L-methionine-dependent methyltransferase n=1 Tax=Coniella lustricola TaxID=2025994 RepID=A0A2T3AGB2_9PEZI|nr:S-adenosyl-L-methionine-dependent methyltransferase [Coniella lustricola]
MPLKMDRITALVNEINQGLDDLRSGDVPTRVKLAQAAFKLNKALEDPREELIKSWLLDSTTKTVVMVALDIKLFRLLGTSPDEARSSTELAEATGAQKSLLSRLLKHLAAVSFIEETGPDKYYAGELAQLLGHQHMQDGLCHVQWMEKSLGALPAYLAEKNYQEPTDGLDCPAHKVFNTKLHMFEYIARDPQLARGFKAAVLSHEGLRRAHWATPAFYPTQERLLTGLKEDSVLLVDVGGGMGLDLLDLHHATGEQSNARLVLQDTEHILSSTDDLPPRIEKITHDFFTPQPIQGARAYYFHRVFHDWSDEKSREILLALKPAMTPGYSRVLIHDTVIPAQGAAPVSTMADLVMMCGLAGRERTEQDFTELLESVGMKVTGIYSRAPGEESVVEALLPE